MKDEYLIAYDYGMGGVWAIIRARSPAEITQKYPMIKVAANRPGWMTDEALKQIRAAHYFDIDDAPTGWLATLVQSSGHSPKK